MSIPFAEFNRRLQEADAAWNITILGPVVMRMMVEDPAITFATVEKQLRENGSRTFLLAAPRSVMPPGVVPMNTDGTEATYWVWMALHGPQEAAQTMQEFGIPSAAENLARLKETGFLAPV